MQSFFEAVGRRSRLRDEIAYLRSSQTGSEQFDL